MAAVHSTVITTLTIILSLGFLIPSTGIAAWGNCSTPGIEYSDHQMQHRLARLPMVDAGIGITAPPTGVSIAL